MITRAVKMAAMLAGVLGLAGFGQASISDWHLSPGGSTFGTGQYANWTPYGGANLNNNTAATNGSISGITYSIWDDYGPHGSGSNNDTSFGGQGFDIKAMYMRNDATKLYVALVTGFNPAGVIDPYNTSVKINMGDLAINPNFASSTAAYGVKAIVGAVGTSGTTKTYAGGTWTTPDANNGFSGAPYSNLTTLGTLVGSDATYSYSSTGVSYYDTVTGQNVPIDLLEFSIPRSEIGATANGTTVNLEWAMTCENDVATSSYTFGNTIPVPEPASIGLVVVAGLFCLSRVRRHRVR